jgi:hypothetical protein
MNDRFRITIRPQHVEDTGAVELRGWLETEDRLVELADALKPLGLWVIASPAESDYDPFTDDNDWSDA